MCLLAEVRVRSKPTYRSFSYVSFESQSMPSVFCTLVFQMLQGQDKPSHFIFIYLSFVVVHYDSLFQTWVFLETATGHTTSRTLTTPSPIIALLCQAKTGDWEACDILGHATLGVQTNKQTNKNSRHQIDTQLIIKGFKNFLHLITLQYLNVDMD